MKLLVLLWTHIFGRYLAPETPVEIYFLGISHFSDGMDRELSFLRSGNWSEFSFHNRKLPVGDFGIGNPVVIVETFELPGSRRRTRLFTKNEFETYRKDLALKVASPTTEKSE